MSFSYTGPVLLTTAAGHHVTLNNVRLWTESNEADRLESVLGGPVQSVILREWRGSARVPGTLFRLMDVLGEAVTVRLADGRTGKAHVTGEAIDSVWVVQIMGQGRPPE